MSPAELPAGAELRSGFSRSAAARLVGLEAAELRRWEQLLGDTGGLRLGPRLALSDVVALAVTSTTARCLGLGADLYAVGLAGVFQALHERPGVERLEGHAALVGRDDARIESRYDTERCAAQDILIIPLGPILAGLRDLAFA